MSQDAQANGVTVLGSSGDSGTANTYKQPPKNPKPIPYPSVVWPASDIFAPMSGHTECGGLLARPGQGRQGSVS
jgi:hypothetical protein